ncbi:MAG: type III pantothenate kinase [Planctomycetota bacterium]|nr:type III pantothenate kinase [Planctomycetota bacterium]
MERRKRVRGVDRTDEKVFLLDVGNTCVTYARPQKNGGVTRPTSITIEKGYIEPLKRRIPEGSVIVLASVNPKVSTRIETEFKGENVSVFVFRRDFKVEMPVLLDKPEEVGADRLLNALAAYRRFGASVVVDCGTANTFDVVSPKGEYLGGAITPGIRISFKALATWTALLPDTKPISAPPLVGKNTRQAMSSGVVYGTAAMIDGMLMRYKKELPFRFTAVATGGASALVIPYCLTKLLHIPTLSLEGLYIAYKESEERRGRDTLARAGRK